jgi:hypothetical protein
MEIGNMAKLKASKVAHEDEATRNKINKFVYIFPFKDIWAI